MARFRPMNRIEEGKGSRNVARFDEDGTAVHLQQEDSPQPITFTFDRVFNPRSLQSEVYEYAAKPLIEDLFQGYYATVFAYGQTGSGKTFTMEGVAPREPADAASESVDELGGGEDLRGVIPRAVEHIFDITQANSELTEFKVTVQYAEIYMERIRDLLDRSGTKNNLEIRVDPARGVYIEGATEVVVKRDGELKKVLSRGSHKRHVSATGMNEESSRSHAICMISVAQKDRMDLTVKTGKLFLVDLAGSEMVSKTGATDQRLEEAKQINKSLSALGNVIKALTDGKSSYIPYRDSKLTRILQDSLGGGSRASLIIACSPASYNYTETVSTLRFGTRAKFIKYKPRVHVGYGGNEMDSLLEKKEQELAALREQVHLMSREVKGVIAANAAYKKVYGAPPVIQADQPPGMSMPEKLDFAVQTCRALLHEVGAIRQEAGLCRRASAEVEKHLREERMIFSQLRSDVSKVALKTISGSGGGDDRLGGEAVVKDVEGIDKILAMAKWKVEGILKKMKPLAIAAGASEVAAKKSAEMAHLALQKCLDGA